MAEQVAVLAGGCFWCTEAVFLDVIGVKSVESGYTGGTRRQPDLQAGVRRRHRPCRGDPRSPSTPTSSATTICSTSSSRPTTRPSSTARAMTSARSIARRSSRRTRAGARGARRDRPRQCRQWRPRRHDDRADGRMVAGRGLSPGLLGRRGAAQSLLHRVTSRPSCRSCARASRRARRARRRRA